MLSDPALQIPRAILKKAKDLGADLAGFASVAQLKKSPSAAFAPQISNEPKKYGVHPAAIQWPDQAQTVLVIAEVHPEEKPELDWWIGMANPAGNRKLAKTISRLCDWISQTYPIETVHLPYPVEKGGIYLKDTAVMAGLGCIGKNNLLITPEYGSRIRLRALALSMALPPTGPTGFNPCADCEEYCRKVCPVNAFNQGGYRPSDYGQEILPGTDGHFSRQACYIQMDRDETAERKEKIDGFEAPVPVIKYCRRCEMACPVGQT